MPEILADPLSPSCSPCSPGPKIKDFKGLVLIPIRLARDARERFGGGAPANPHGRDVWFCVRRQAERLRACPPA
jgi:hypothetical protein